MARADAKQMRGRMRVQQKDLPIFVSPDRSIMAISLITPTVAWHMSGPDLW